MNISEVKYYLHRKGEAVTRWIAWHLPKKLVMWAYFRVLSYATSGKYGKTIVPDITAMDAVDRWIKDKNL